MLPVNDFSSSWNTLYTILLQVIIYLHLCRISDESSHKEKIIMNDDSFVCNIQLAVATNLLVINFKAV